MRGFERNFLLAEGLPDRIQYRHVVSRNIISTYPSNPSTTVLHPSLTKVWKIFSGFDICQTEFNTDMWSVLLALIRPIPQTLIPQNAKSVFDVFNLNCERFFLDLTFVFEDCGLNCERYFLDLKFVFEDCYLNCERYFLDLKFVFEDCGSLDVWCLWRLCLPWYWRHPLQHQRTSEEIYNLKNMIYNVQSTVL